MPVTVFTENIVENTSFTNDQKCKNMLENNVISYKKVIALNYFKIPTC